MLIIKATKIRWKWNVCLFVWPISYRLIAENIVG